MSTLHTISKPPSSGLLNSCLTGVSENDALLFIEDGVYHGSKFSPDLETPHYLTLFSLEEDVMARGLNQSTLSNINIINYNDFVDLCVRYDKVVNWF
ncbi:MAG: sulfurtransferase complex subunit TusB [Gammaproteobacteria bacterium]|nr:sulfurtransferase complex subunit TusB [Gammaproteobacteria bacterium]